MKNIIACNIHNNKILILIIFSAIIVLAGFGFAREASAAGISGYLISKNLLSGVSPAPTSIDSFVYNLSAKPSNTTSTVQFSQDSTNWYNSSRVLDGTDTLEEGTHTIDLSGLNWSGANFYYKVIFTSPDGIITPVLDEITLIWTEGEARKVDCESVMSDYSQELPDEFVCPEEGEEKHPPEWTNCKCKYENLEGYRISPVFDFSGPEKVKDSRIFWQANERFDGTIKVEVRVSYDGGNNWDGWIGVVNGGSIPGLEPGTNLSGAKIQTKTSFVGGPNFYPSLENIKIFIELE